MISKSYRLGGWIEVAQKLVIGLTADDDRQKSRFLTRIVNTPPGSLDHV
jgi:hypothetical protein